MQHLRRSSALALAGLLAATAVPACRGPRQPTDAPTTSPGTGSPSAPVGLTPAATLVTSTPDAGSASPTIATGEPSPTPSPATTAPPDGLPAIGWAAQPSDFAPFDSITETVRTERGLVAVGSRDSGDVQHAAGWLSSDGRSWAAVELPGSEFAALEDVVGGPSVIVAVGFSHAGDATRPAIWASLDGTSWTRAAGDLGRGELVAVAYAGDGFVALGGDPATDERVLAWTSVDGLAWLGPQEVSGIGPGAAINGLRALAGRLLAFGSDDAGRPALWLSSDGVAWQAAIGPSDGQGAVNEVASRGTGLVAVGADYSGESAMISAWLSEDGLDWQAADTRRLDGEMLGVAALGGGYLAVGGRDVGEFRFDAAVWTSSDGAAWQHAPLDPTFVQARMFEVLALEGEVLAIGERSIGDAAEEFEPAVWLGMEEER